MRGGGRGKTTSGRRDSGEEGVEEQSCETSADPGLLSADLPTDNRNQHGHVSISLYLSPSSLSPFPSLSPTLILPLLLAFHSLLEHQIRLQVLQLDYSTHGRCQRRMSGNMAGLLDSPHQLPVHVCWYRPG